MRNFEAELKGLASNKAVLWTGAAIAALAIGYYMFGGGSGDNASATPYSGSGLLSGSPVAYGTPSSFGVDPSSGVTDASGTTGGADLTYLTDLVQLQTLTQQENNALGILNSNNSLTLGEQSIASQTTIALANVDATKYAALTALTASLNSSFSLPKGKGFQSDAGSVTVGGQTASFDISKVGNNYNAPQSMFYTVSGYADPRPASSTHLTYPGQTGGATV